MASIQRLEAGEGERLRAVRLWALRDAPDAFETTYAEAAARPAESWEAQLAALETFVAVVDGRDVGLVRAAPHEERADAGYLISMWVAPEARGQGIGDALVEAVAGWARSCGWTHLFLDVGEQNAPAMGLYRRHGFAPTGVTGALPPPREHVREVQLVCVVTP